MLCKSLLVSVSRTLHKPCKLHPGARSRLTQKPRDTSRRTGSPPQTTGQWADWSCSNTVRPALPAYPDLSGSKTWEIWRWSSRFSGPLKQYGTPTPPLADTTSTSAPITGAVSTKELAHSPERRPAMSSSSAGQHDPGHEPTIPPQSDADASMTDAGAVAAAVAATAAADSTATDSSQAMADAPAQPTNHPDVEPSPANTTATPAIMHDAPPAQQPEVRPTTPSHPVQPVVPPPTTPGAQSSLISSSHPAQEPPVTPIRNEAANTGALEPTNNMIDQNSRSQQQSVAGTSELGPPTSLQTERPIQGQEGHQEVERGTDNLQAPAVIGQGMDQSMNMNWNQLPQTPSTPLLDMHQAAARMLRLMNPANASFSSPHHTIVTPAQVTLPPPPPEDQQMLDVSAGPNSAAANNSNPHLESFARIEFQDSVFQMTTYAVVIGRDQGALLQARRDEKRASDYQRRIEDAAVKGQKAPSPLAYETKFSKSYVSEEGGMLGPESDGSDESRPAKRRKTSTGESSQNDQEGSGNVISNRQYVSHTPGAVAVDLAALRPSPDHVPFIGIHSPGPNIAAKTKAISREHLKIAFNKETNVFEAIPLHKNGFFCEDVHYTTQKVVLRCGDRLQIKDVDFTFIINGVPMGGTGAEDLTQDATRVHKQGGKEMSFDFEQSFGNEQMQDTSDSENELTPPPLSDEDDGPDEEGDENDEDDNDDPEKMGGDDTMQEHLTADGDPLMPQIPRKRGPGRPPKNGFMSKREQRLLKKQQQELAKKTLPQPPPIEPPIKRKVGRPRKHPLPDNAGDQPEKRKYKPRKPKNEDGEEGSDAERKAKEKKDKKVRSKSPPLHLNREDYTQEDLQKPPKNYSMLIDEALTGNPDGLTLKQIYKRICLRYPHFYFNVETKGWESSVRHNLIGNKAFRKDEERGVWLRLPGVDLDSSKKTRKGNTPDRDVASHGYGAYGYPQYNAQHVQGGVPGYPPGHIPPNFQMPNPNAQQQPAQPVQPYAPRPAAPAPAQAQPIQAQVQAQAQASGAQAPAQPSNQAQAQAQVPGYGHTLPPAPARPQAGPSQPTAYNQQYAPRPAVSSGPVIKTEEGGVSAAAHQVSQPQPAAPPKPVYQPQGIQQPQPNNHVPHSNQHPPQHQQPPQQAMGQPSRPSAASPPAAAPAPPIDPVLLRAVVSLKNGLILNLKKASNPHADTIVYSALNRCAGLKKEATDQNDNMERICMKGIQQVIDGFRSKHRSPTPGSTPTEHKSALIDPSVVRTLVGFKDVSCNTLKGNLGAVQAEAVTLSAIDRVLGLADESWLNDDKLVNMEEKLINTAKQLLETLNQRRAQSTEAAR